MHSDVCSKQLCQQYSFHSSVAFGLRCRSKNNQPSYIELGIWMHKKPIMKERHEEEEEEKIKRENEHARASITEEISAAKANNTNSNHNNNWLQPRKFHPCVVKMLTKYKLHVVSLVVSRTLFLPFAVIFFCCCLLPLLSDAREYLKWNRITQKAQHQLFLPNEVDCVLFCYLVLVSSWLALTSVFWT